tara:strand:+ start:51 stop:1115 length:1065 start_codon:yes stop_codon:yes gene_type:complete
MLHHSLHRPRLLIDGTEVLTFISGSFSDKGGSTLQSFSANFSDPDLEDMPLLNKRVELYLNNGSIDGAPLFRGYIKQFTSSDKNIKIKALDPRMFITGKAVVPVVIDDKKNYDGNTVVQFLLDYIDNIVNSNETIMTTEYLHEMDRPVFMTGIRAAIIPYDTVKNLVESKIDDESQLDRTDGNDIFNYFFDIIHGGEYSGLTIRKRRALNDNADMSFKYGDGITSLKYNERAPPSYALGTVKDTDEQVVFEYGNAPLGNVGLETSDVEGDSRGEVRENLIAKVILEQQFTKEISISCSKGYNLGLGNIINIDVPKMNLHGNYAITGKNISISKSGLTCTLRCNNKPILLRDYLN